MFLFILLLLIALWVGRRIALQLARLSLVAGTILSIIISLFWGMILAIGYRFLVCWSYPGLVLTFIGYLGPLYVSMIHSGNTARMTSTRPDRLDAQMLRTNYVSMISYIVFSIVFYFKINF
jgi:hypothetical protein